MSDMTAAQQFERWYKANPKVIYNYPDGLKAWLAAYAEATERAAKIAEGITACDPTQDYPGDPCPKLRRRIAQAIRGEG